ncbi:MAG: hypothetical protein HQL46_00515 [Gammaproteobacteria bacterium]|nr:hypothetical protein [Gammaproteobacteria bacterium]
MIFIKQGIYVLLMMLSLLLSMSGFAQPYPYWQAPGAYPVNNYQAHPYNVPQSYANQGFSPYSYNRMVNPRLMAPRPTPYPAYNPGYNYNRPYTPVAPMQARGPITGPVGPIGPLVPPAYPYARNNPYANRNNRFPMNPFNNRSFSGKSFPGKNSFFSDHGMPYERRFYERGPFDKDSWTKDEDDGQFGIFDIIPSNKFGEYWDGFIDGPNDSGDIPGSPIKWPQILMPDPFDVSEQLEDAAYETPSIPLYGTYGTTGNTSGSDDEYDDD